MKASEFGQSLLSDIREKNKEEQRRAEKRAKREAWKAVGAKIAMNVVQDSLKARHQKLVANESKMQKKIVMDNVYSEFNNFSNTVKESDDYAGGEKAYATEEILRPLISADLKSRYSDGTYSKSKFKSLEDSLVSGYSDTFFESFSKRKKAHKQFLISGDKDTYYNNIKTMTGDGTIGSSLTQLIKKIPGVSKLTGNINEDLRQTNQEIIAQLQGEKGLQTYQNAYRQTRDVELAAHVAKHIKDIDLGAPANDYGKEQKIKVPNGLGGEREILVRSETSFNKDGSVKMIRKVQLTGEGYKPVSTENFQGFSDFLTGAGLLSDDIVETGKVVLQGVDAKQSSKILAAQKEYVDEAFSESQVPKSSPLYGKIIEGRNDLLARHIAMSGLTARNEGWSTPTAGRKLSLHMILKDIDGGGYGDNVITGLDNPFETMIAAHELQEKGELSGDETISEIAMKGVKLYDAYYALDGKSKETLTGKLEQLDYFDDYADGGRIEAAIATVKYAADNFLNPEDFGGKSQMLEYAKLKASQLYNQENKDDEEEEEIMPKTTVRRRTSLFSPR